MKVLLGVTGSIAAYKAIDLMKELQNCDHEVKVVVSKGGQNFISLLTLRSIFQDVVYSHDQQLDEHGRMLHIDLAKFADVVLIAPASANFISKLANGAADCLLSEICLATKAKIILAPAMNQAMWGNQIVQNNLKSLQDSGAAISLGVSYGKQACGDVGFGRMLEISDICEGVEYLNQNKRLKNKKILITSGPTLEKIDPVRFITNFSSGKMGDAISRAAVNMGASVTIISGPTSIKYHSLCDVVNVESSSEMEKEVLEKAKDADIFISCAAVCDFKPESVQSNKIKKKDSLQLNLIKNTDILAHVKSLYKDLFCVGFAAETHSIEEFGKKKLIEKKIDMIAINDVSNGGVFGKDENELHVFTKNQKKLFLKKDKKKNIAKSLIEFIADEIM